MLHLTPLAYSSSLPDGDLKLQLKGIPEGFHGLCSRSLVSKQVQSIIRAAADYTDEIWRHSKDVMTRVGEDNIMWPNVCARILQEAGGAESAVESWLVLALMAYNLDALPSKPLQPLTSWILRLPPLPTPSYLHHQKDEDVARLLLWTAIILEMVCDSSMVTLFGQYRTPWNLLGQIFSAQPRAQDWKWIKEEVSTMLWTEVFADRAHQAWELALVTWRRKMAR
jgi:hypothetical protein